MSAFELDRLKVEVAIGEVECLAEVISVFLNQPGFFHTDKHPTAAELNTLVGIHLLLRSQVQKLVEAFHGPDPAREDA